MRAPPAPQAAVGRLDFPGKNEMRSPNLEIQIIVDNTAGDGLLAEHGLSVLIRDGDRRILFDTGQGAAFEKNAHALGVDLATIDVLVLSHGHYDHTGGIPTVVRSRPDIDVFLHSGALRSRFAVDGRGAREIGMPHESLQAIEKLRGRHRRLVRRSARLGERIGLCTAIERSTDYEDTGGPFFLDAEALRPDRIEDDLALWIRTEAGLVVVVGCCHAGIINTLRRARRDAGDARIHAVIGGLHLLNAGPGRLDSTMSALAMIAPGLIVPCHCTGEGAVAALRDAFEGRVEVGRSGAVFRFYPGGGQGPL